MNVKNESGALFHGVGINNGCVSGKLKFFQRGRTGVEIIADMPSAGVPDVERARLERALTQLRGRLSELYRRTLADVGEQEAQIFEIHAMLLEDEDLTESLEREIANGCRAELAVQNTAQQYAALLKGLDDPYLSARAADLSDLSEQLCDLLSGTERRVQEKGGEPYILVAEDLAPSETVSLDKSEILGFVTFGGTPNSHTSILARAMGIPALVGVGEIAPRFDGCLALLNAADGSLTVCPNESQVRAFQIKQREENELAKEHERYLRSLINKPAITRGGHKMLIYANVGEAHEIEPALLNGAEGIGLLRSEFLYLSMDRYPTEEELFESYRDIVRKMQGKRIVIRTLDIGADKQIPYFDLPREENPALGFRGVRICLAREALFKTQLRAILRASAHGSISLMVPMIVSVEEVHRCRRLLDECCAELQNENIRFDPNLEFGIMLETPAAAIMSEELAAEVDFFSVGTNDLTQYTLAADRQNPQVAEICEENREPVLRLIAQAADAIHRHDGWIGICGELAAELQLTQRFADMRIDELSVSVPYLLGVREKVTACK